MSNYLAEIVTNILLIILAGIIFVYSITADVKCIYPLTFVSSAIIICNLILMFRKSVWNLKNNFTSNEHLVAQETEAIKSWKFSIPYLVILLCLSFVYFVPIVGFEISAVLFMIVIPAIIDWKQIKRWIFLSIIVPAVLILVFYFGLNLRLPLLITELF